MCGEAEEGGDVGGWVGGGWLSDMLLHIKQYLLKKEIHNEIWCQGPENSQRLCKTAKGKTR